MMNPSQSIQRIAQPSRIALPHTVPSSGGMIGCGVVAFQRARVIVVPVRRAALLRFGVVNQGAGWRA